MPELVIRSALHERAAAQGAAQSSIALQEIVDRGMIDLRGMASDARFLTAVNEALGFELPLSPRSAAGAGDMAALWMSVDQWLVTLPRADAPQFQARLSGALHGVHALVVDMSDARAILRLEGETVREVLNKGTSVDFTARDMRGGVVRRLRYAEIAAMAHVVSTTPDVIDLYVFRSTAEHVWAHLLATARPAARVKL
ncbi:MAG TPA: sarcosine oxidase subunit gamma family protein, partial [Burkholderiales bacterium]|nr:sarcosine oxidase subunit gamma family protein [Burkholderiales bacterium]